MSKIDLEYIIQEKKLDKSLLAAHLFPKNKHPNMAIARVMKGEAFLDSQQVSKLAAMAGMSIAEVYGDFWRYKSKENTVTLQRKEYFAELDTDTWITKVFHNNEVFHESLLHSKSITLKNYLLKLDEIISNHDK